MVFGLLLTGHSQFDWWSFVLPCFPIWYIILTITQPFSNNPRWLPHNMGFSFEITPDDNAPFIALILETVFCCELLQTISNFTLTESVIGVYTAMCAYVMCMFICFYEWSSLLRSLPTISGSLVWQTGRVGHTLSLAILWVLVSITLVIDWNRAGVATPRNHTPQEISQSLYQHSYSFGAFDEGVIIVNDFCSSLVIIIADALLVSKLKIEHMLRITLII